MSKQYMGRRFPEGDAVVEVHENGIAKDLPLRFDICNHSPTGFNWGYAGSGPAQLALAILADFKGKVPTAKLYQEFKNRFIVGIKEDRWEITERMIAQFILEQDPNGDLGAFLSE